MKEAQHIPKSKLLNVIDEASSSFFSTRAFPQEASGVNDRTKHNGCGNIGDQSEDDELYSQGKRPLFLIHRSAGFDLSVMTLNMES